MRILIFEVKDTNRKLLETVLSEYGVCRVTADGNTAIDLFRQALNQRDFYDLIVVDVSMPDHNGMIVLRQIRETEKTSNVTMGNKARIVAVTGKLGNDEMKLLLDIDCDDYLVKPFNSQNIIDVMNDI